MPATTTRRSPYITPGQDVRAHQFLGELSLRDRGAFVPEHVQTGDHGASPIQKSLKDYSKIVSNVGTTGRHETASWIVDRNEYVKHYTGSTFMAIGAIANKIARQEAEVFHKVVKKSGVQLEPVSPTHPLVELFGHVNPLHSQFDLWYQMVAWRLLTGDSYWWKARNGFGVPAELWPLPSQWVWAVPSETEFIGEYLVRAVFGRESHIPSADVLHIREPNIDWSGNGRYYGCPRLKAAATAVDLEESMFKRLYHHFRNFAPPGLHYTTDEKLTEEQFMEMMAQIHAQHSQAEQSGAPIVSHSGFKTSEFKQTVREMDYSQSLDTIMSYILAVHGTPRAVTGQTKDVNRANMIGAMVSWVETTINPLLTHLSQHLTQNLAMDFDENLVVKLPEATVSDDDAIRKDMVVLVRAGAVTPDEIREVLLDMGPLEGGVGKTPLFLLASGSNDGDEDGAGGDDTGRVGQDGANVDDEAGSTEDLGEGFGEDLEDDLDINKGIEGFSVSRNGKLAAGKGAAARFFQIPVTRP